MSALRPDARGAPDTATEPPATDVPVLDAGARVGPYLIVDRLGVGGMGAVYLGTDTRLHRKVALKCLTPHGADPDLRSKVLHEARAAARITHPNVAVVHDVVEDNGRAFIVMEYVEGESLAARMRRERVTVAAAVAFGRQLAAALAAAHASGIVHRDLKPANVQVTHDGAVKVLDFGIAHRTMTLATTSTEAPTTVAGDRMRQPGTPPYMAPEQLMGEGADERSDIYSLGVVLYEMIAGRRPFAGTRPAQLLAAMTDRPPSLHAVDATVPRALSAVVDRAIATNPNARFQSAVELSTALEPFEGGGAGRLGARRIWRSRTGAIAAGLAVFVAALVGVPMLMTRRAPPRAAPPVVAVMPFESGGDSRVANLGVGLAEIVSANLSTIPGVVVVPRASTTRYEAGPSALARAAKDLGLDYALVGSAQGREGGRRVVLSLAQPSTGAVVATRTFEVSDANMFPAFAEIARWSVEQVERLGQMKVTAPAALPTTNLEALEDYAQGRQYLDRRDVTGNIGRAIAALERAVARDPKFALAHASLGDAHWADYLATRERPSAEKAKDATLEALRLDPGQPMARYALALIYQGTGRRQDAVDELQKAIAVQPSNDELHRLLGRIYGDLGEVDKAVAESMSAIRLRPGFWANYRALGIIELNAGRYQDAVATLTRLTELQPDSATGFQLLGTAYHELGDLERALVNYTRANTIAPSSTAWANIGTIQYARRRYTDAASAYREAIRLQPKEPSLYRNLGDALRASGDRAGARSAYRQAIATCDERLGTERNDEKLLALKALCLAKVGNIAEARRVIATALAIRASGPVLYQLAIIDTIEQRADDALTALAQAIDKGYSRSYAAEDDEFLTLRHLPRFHEIVSAR